MANSVRKVVIIETQYIETDAASFKSVVQSLTGKGSSVSEEGLCKKKRRKDVLPPPVAGNGGGKTQKQPRAHCDDGGDSGNGGIKALSNDKWFNRESLELQIPSMEDLSWLWAELVSS